MIGIACVAARPLTPSHLASLAKHRYVVIPNWLDSAATARICQDALALADAGLAVPCAVGDRDGMPLDGSQRESRQCSLRPPPANHIGCVKTRDDLESSVNSLREQLQSSAQLELPQLQPFLTELKYLLYPVGGHFGRHLDAQIADDGWRRQGRSSADGGSLSGSALRRVISFILYLNSEWSSADGGELRVFPAYERGRGQHTEHTADILPEGGTLVILASADVEHLVRETRKERQCVVGWFREERCQRVPDRDAMALRDVFWST